MNVEDEFLRLDEWQDQFDGAKPGTPELFEEEYQHPENRGLDAKTQKVWIPRSSKCDLVLWTRKDFCQIRSTES